jgi:hypothetical protein
VWIVPKRSGQAWTKSPESKPSGRAQVQDQTAGTNLRSRYPGGYYRSQRSSRQRCLLCRSRVEWRVLFNPKLFRSKPLLTGAREAKCRVLTNDVAFQQVNRLCPSPWTCCYLQHDLQATAPRAVSTKLPDQDVGSTRSRSCASKGRGAEFIRTMRSPRRFCELAKRRSNQKAKETVSRWGCCCA